MEFVHVPEGRCFIGSTLTEVEECVGIWGDKLVDPAYSREEFYEWILKEYPRHEVTVKEFQIGRFPVKNAEYWPFVRTGRAKPPESILRGEPEEYPVWGVAFEDCCAFAEWFGEKLGCVCRLPMEAEWEYSARGPMGYEYPFGNEFDSSKCNTIEAGIGHTTPVDKYAKWASAFGVCDLAGNVEEWTLSPYEAYEGGEQIADDLVRECGASYRVLRGGSFALGGDLARCARRHGPHPAPRFRYRGFRLVLPNRNVESGALASLNQDARLYRS